MLQYQTPFDENDRPAIAIPPPTSSKGHQRSRTTVDLPPLHTRTGSASPTRFSTFLPSLRSNSRTASPERVSVKEAAEFDVGAHEPSQKQKPTGVKNLASWFEGSSEPVNITLVPSTRKEKADPVQDVDSSEKMFSASNDSLDNLTKRPQNRPAVPAGSSRFSFFRKASQVQSPTLEGDELATLDIRETLFPAGPPDEFSPAALKNLQLNAEGLLRRFQSTHIDQQRAIKSLNATRQSQTDDLEASNTRNEHLKLQLVEMAEKAAEQERLIEALRMELDSVHRGTHETKDRSIRKVSSNSESRAPFRRDRSSNISNVSAESDESSNISVFSAADSMDSPGTSIAASPVMKHARMHYTAVQHQSPTSHLQYNAVIPVHECQQCHGVKASEAWDVVTMMKAESQALKQRIADLEGANDEALSFLDGLNMR